MLQCLPKVDREKVLNLISGIVGIYACFIIGGLLHQSLLKSQYVNRVTGEQSLFQAPVGIVGIQKLTVTIMAVLYNRLFIKKEDRTSIPMKNSLYCAMLIFCAALASNYAIALVSYPVVITSQSCNILSVVLVGVLCSRVRDSNLILGPRKIFVALMVTVGVILFQLFDPETKDQQQDVYIGGMVLIFIMLLANGFLPDFQAEIKSKFKPTPTEMMADINKWCSLFSFVYAVAMGQLLYTFEFMWFYPWFTFDLLLMTVLSFFGTFFVYRMIKQFRQHMVPFVITTRKIVTVVVSLIYYEHEFSLIQVLAIILIFGTTLFQFCAEIKVKEVNMQHSIIETIDSQKMIECESETVQTQSLESYIQETLHKKGNTLILDGTEEQIQNTGRTEDQA